METHNGCFRSRQTRLLKTLFALCEQGSLGKPRPEGRYLCIARNDSTHGPTMPGTALVVSGSATRAEGFHHRWFHLGVCRNCFENEEEANRMMQEIKERRTATNKIRNRLAARDRFGQDEWDEIKSCAGTLRSHVYLWEQWAQGKEGALGQ